MLKFSTKSQGLWAKLAALMVVLLMTTFQLKADETQSTVVTTSNDIIDPNDGLISFREAIMYASEIGGPITFDESIETVYIENSVCTIEDTVTINAGSVVFTMTDYTKVHGALKINGGDETYPVIINGGVFKGFNDIAICITNQGYLVVNGTRILENTSNWATSANKANGVAIYNQGTALIDNAFIAGNSSYREGDATWAAIFNNSGAVLAISNSVITGNYAGCGSGITNCMGTVVVYNCTVAGNWSWYDNGQTFGDAIFGYDVLGYGGITHVYNTISVDNIGGNANLTLTSSYTGDAAGFVAAPSYSDGWNKEAYKNWDLRLSSQSAAMNIGDNTKAKTAANSSVLISKDMAGEDRVCNTTVDAGAYEYTVKVTPYTGTYDGNSHCAIKEIYAPTGYDVVFYSTDGDNWTDETAAITFRDAGSRKVYVWVAVNDNVDVYLECTSVISPIQLTVDDSWVEPNLPGVAEALVHVGTVSGVISGDDVTVTATGTFQSTEIGKGIPVDVQYQVNGAKKANYTAPVNEVLYGDINTAEQASMIVTTDREVVNAADGLISLREALTVYYGTNGCDTVTFADGLTTINLDSEFKLDNSYEGLVIDGGGDIIFDGEKFAIFYITKDVTVTFKGITFKNITNSGMGAALRCDWDLQGGSFDKKITFDGCDFIGNKGSYGSVAMLTGITGVFKHCTFDGNNGAYGAVWMCYGNLEVDSCSFTNNISTSTGGALSATADDNSLYVNISNSTFSGNTASSQGGAIYTELASLTITESEFTNNSGSAGGAISATHWSKFTQFLSPVVITINKTKFDGNTCRGNGGAISAICPQFAIDSTEFTNNRAAGDFFSRAAAIYTENSVATSTIKNTKFEGNFTKGTGSSMGGALNLQTTGWVAGSNYQITGCDFINNTAGADGYYYGYGGACYVAGKTTFKDCNFTGNSAYIADDNDGNGEMKGGALYIVAGGDKVQLWNCAVKGNYVGGNAQGSTAKITDTYGAGIYTDSAIDIIQCLVADNTLYGATKSRGAGIGVGSAPVSIWYSTIAGNKIIGGDALGGGIYNKGAITTYYSIIASNSAKQGNDVYNSDYFALQGSVYDAEAIKGNYTPDAKCVDIEEGDALFEEDGYNLVPKSIAINLTGMTEVFDYTEDLAGTPRLLGKYVDAGCYECKLFEVSAKCHPMFGTVKIMDTTGYDITKVVDYTVLSEDKTVEITVTPNLERNGQLVQWSPANDSTMSLGTNDTLILTTSAASFGDTAFVAIMTGEVRITVEPSNVDGGEVKIKYADTGVELTEEQCQHIEYNTELTIEAVAYNKSGYAFAGWYDKLTGEIFSGKMNCTFKAKNDMQLEARFSDNVIWVRVKTPVAE